MKGSQQLNMFKHCLLYIVSRETTSETYSLSTLHC